MTTPDPASMSSALTVAIEGDRSLTITIDRSAGVDNAVLVQIDTDFEPDGSDGSPGLRVHVNDSTVYEGVGYRAEHPHDYGDYSDVQ